MAQLVKHLTPDSASGQDLRVGETKARARLGTGHGASLRFPFPLSTEILNKKKFEYNIGI